jgi:hypothetical protein
LGVVLILTGMGYASFKNIEWFWKTQLDVSSLFLPGKIFVFRLSLDKRADDTRKCAVLSLQKR